MRSQFIDKQKTAWPGTFMCRMFGVSRSGYDDWTQIGLRPQILSNVDLDRRIRRIFTGASSTGWRTPVIAKTLQQEGFQCSENRIARSMQVLNLRAIQAKKFKVTTDSNHSKSVAPHVIKQGFHAVMPNQKWTSDITYVWTVEGWLYLVVVQDLYSRAILGWAMNHCMTQHLVCNALTMDLFRHRFAKVTIIHSDRSRQYYSQRCQQLIKSNGLCCSMGHKANCYDNAVTESFFHTLKVELVH